jgi:lipopolysaccharide transport system ATP-binding protein
MEPAIRVENLGKRYYVSQNRDTVRYKTFRESLTNAFLSPFRRFTQAGDSGPIDEFWALKDVSFDIQPGEVVGIIGRNGAGKSTLLKILSRITKPTTGRIEINGRVGSLLEVGTGFHPELTGRENIYLNGSILGMSRAEIKAKFDEIVAFAEVEEFLDTPVKRYSSGMYVRLAFAVAAHLEPEILIVDEVLAVGDAAFQKKCLGKMKDVASSGKTVLIVSHNISQVLKTCTRGVYLENGNVLFQGNIAEAASRYSNAHIDQSNSLCQQGITATVVLLNNHGAVAETWRYGEELIATIEVSSQNALKRPAVDLAFYDEMGTRLFAIQTDRASDNSPTSTHNIIFKISISNSVLNCSSVIVDLGVRESPSQNYIAWWQRIRTIPISNSHAPNYFCPGSLIGMPYKVTTKST